MEIKTKYILKYLRRIALDQLSDEYKAKGYTVQIDTKVGDFNIDLIAKKEGETIIIEVKANDPDSNELKYIENLVDYVTGNLKNVRFQIAFVSPPKSKKIYIEKVDELLISELNENLPSELDELSSNSIVDEVFDIDYEEIYIEDNEIYISGNALITVTLNYGSPLDREDEYADEASMTFPLNFNLKFELDNGEMKTINFTPTIDTSSFYD